MHVPCKFALSPASAVCLEAEISPLVYNRRTRTYFSTARNNKTNAYSLFHRKSSRTYMYSHDIFFNKHLQYCIYKGSFYMVHFKIISRTIRLTPQLFYLPYIKKSIRVISFRQIPRLMGNYFFSLGQILRV